MRKLLPLILVALFSPLASAQIQWRPDLKSARTESEQTGKPILMHFQSANCTYCEQLERGAYTDPALQHVINQWFVPLRVDGSASAVLVDTFKVERFPTDVIVMVEGGKGKVLSRQVSPQETGAYLAMLRQPWEGTQYAEQIAQGANDQQHLADRPAIQSQSQQLYGPMGPEPSFGMTPASPVGMPIGQPLTYGPPSPNETGGYGTTPTGTSTAANTAASTTPHQSPRPNKAPALDGFCPVAMVIDEQWVPGNAQWGVIHLGETYLFSSENARKLFLENPERYAPVLNGIDAVKFMDERQIVPGRIEFGFFDPATKRVFLFSSEESAKRFESNFDRYAPAAIQITQRAAADANPSH